MKRIWFGMALLVLGGGLMTMAIVRHAGRPKGPSGPAGRWEINVATIGAGGGQASTPIDNDWSEEQLTEKIARFAAIMLEPQRPLGLQDQVLAAAWFTTAPPQREGPATQPAEPSGESGEGAQPAAEERAVGERIWICRTRRGRYFYCPQGRGRAEMLHQETFSSSRKAVRSCAAYLARQFMNELRR